MFLAHTQLTQNGTGLRGSSGSPRDALQRARHVLTVALALAGFAATSTVIVLQLGGSLV